MTATLGRPVQIAPPALELRGVGKTFGTGPTAVTALRDIDLTVRPGEFVCLLGASGCGKSTLLNVVAALEEPSAGDIDLRTGRPSFMFQESALLPWLTAGRNVELPLQLSGVGRRERRERAAELLSLVRLDGQGAKRPHELSGGMRQRVSLARALASATSTEEPGLLLMDEPFAALDAITRDMLQGELLRVWEATGTTILFVTHDVREAVRLAQRVVLLSSRPGTIVREWEVGGGDHEVLHDDITARLRQVITSHAA
jgi:NitT/TauT family transport system ATP-binding protein